MPPKTIKSLYNVIRAIFIPNKNIITQRFILFEYQASKQICKELIAHILDSLGTPRHGYKQSKGEILLWHIKRIWSHKVF